MELQLWYRGGQQLQAGAGTLQSSVKMYTDGAADLKDGITALDRELQQKLGQAEQLPAAMDALITGADQMIRGADDLKAGANQAKNAAAGLQNRVAEFSGAVGTAQGLVGMLPLR